MACYGDSFTFFFIWRSFVGLWREVLNSEAPYAALFIATWWYLCNYPKRAMDNPTKLLNDG
jgi:hypothetical protein